MLPTKVPANLVLDNQKRASLIAQKRQALNMTQKELSDAIGLPLYGERSIRRYEKGEVTIGDKIFNEIMSFPDTPPFISPKGAKYRSIDLFAGIGGIRLGFEQTNQVRTVFASEWDKFAQKTYRANFGEVPQGDITQIDEKDVPDHDILLAGFPCQAFSQAGRKLGFSDTRGTLFFDVTRIIKEKRPKAFLLENVKNLKSHDHGRTFKVIQKTLEELEYDLHVMLFKARDFGAPQNRERIYLVGFDKNLDFSLPFIPPTPTKRPTSVGSILEQGPIDERFTISDKLWQGHQNRKKAHQKKGNGFGYSLFNAHSPYTNTLSARYYKDGSEILIEQLGKNPRKLTPREAARLQGFPEDFIIPVSNTQSYKQFGNSVCVLTINAIAEEMIKTLNSEI